MCQAIDLSATPPRADDAFVWGPEFMTGIPEVDDQHRELVAIINAIGEYTASGGDRDANELAPLFERLRDYTVFHFTEEETLMASAALPATEVAPHKQEHAFFITEVERACAAGTAMASADAILRFLTSWLVHHILGRDKTMARQLARIAAGESPERACAREVPVDGASTKPLLSALHVLFRQVADSNERLRALNESLERRVVIRTQELRRTIAQLEREEQASRRLSDELSRANQHLEAIAMTDVLTGLPNRRHAIARLERAWRESAHCACGVSLMLVDADGFKTVNDTFGHDAGDDVLIALAKELRNSVRTDDIVCRMGGDEFLIACPHTPLEAAMKLAETTCRRINEMRVKAGAGEWRGSISIGVAERTPDMQNIEALIKAADSAVYRAKRAGRNCVRSARPKSSFQQRTARKDDDRSTVTR